MKWVRTFCDTPQLTELHLSNFVGLADETKPVISLISKLKGLRVLRFQCTTYLQRNKCSKPRVSKIRISPVWKRVRNQTKYKRRTIPVKLQFVVERKSLVFQNRFPDFLIEAILTHLSQRIMGQLIVYHYSRHLAKILTQTLCV